MPRLPARASSGAAPEFSSTLSTRRQARALLSNAQARIRRGHTLCSHAASTKLLVLDLDGVLVDSEPEVRASDNVIHRGHAAGRCRSVDAARIYRELHQHVTSAASEQMRNMQSARPLQSREGSRSGSVWLDSSCVDNLRAMQVSEADVRAACLMWPDAFPADVHSALQSLKPDMRKLRPVLVDGYETMMMARMLQGGAHVDELAADWPTAFASGCKAYHTSVAVLEPYLESFRQVRSRHPCAPCVQLCCARSNERAAVCDTATAKSCNTRVRRVQAEVDG